MNLFSRARCVSVARAGRRKRALMVQHPKYDLSEEIKRDQPTLLTRVFSSITRIKKVGNAGARICLYAQRKEFGGRGRVDYIQKYLYFRPFLLFRAIGIFLVRERYRQEKDARAVRSFCSLVVRKERERELNGKETFSGKSKVTIYIRTHERIKPRRRVKRFGVSSPFALPGNGEQEQENRFFMPRVLFQFGVFSHRE